MNLKFDQREVYYRDRRMKRPLRLCVCAALCVFVIAALTWLYNWYIMRGAYSFTIQSGKNLTQEVVDGIGSRAGVEAFSPILQTNVILEVNGYQTSVLLTGVDFDTYPLQYDTWIKELFVGSQPVILIGENCFSSLMDHNQHMISEEDAQSLLISCQKSLGIGEGELPDWISQEERMMIEENREEFMLSLYMEEDALDVVIGGILKYPESEIVMRYEDLRRLLSEAAMDTGVKQAWITVKGMENAVSLQEELVAAGMEADTVLAQQMEAYQSVQRNCLLLMMVAGGLTVVLFRYLTCSLYLEKYPVA